MANLPRPISTTDFYLAAILEELKALGQSNNQLEPEIIVLKESIPDDFPGKTALELAGIDSLDDIPRDGDTLVSIKGIGKVKAGEILTWLSQ